MKYYKVFTDFTNYISIDETELEKALTAFQRNVGVIFKDGATKRIDLIIPDYVKMMGWNSTYKPTPEDMGEIEHDPKCKSAKRLLAEIKDHIALNSGQPFQRKELGTITYTQEPTQIGKLMTKNSK